MYLKERNTKNNPDFLFQKTIYSKRKKIKKNYEKNEFKKIQETKTNNKEKN